MKRNFIFFAFILFCFFTFTPVIPAPHISGKFIKGQPKDKVKLLPDVSHLRRKGAPAIEIAKAIGSVGEKKVAVIVVKFPDQNFSSGWYNQANTTFQRLKDYYNEVSYGKLQLDITFFYDGGSTKTLTGNEKAYTLSKPTTDYAYLPWLDYKEIERRLIELVKIAISTSGVSSSDYHCVMVLHAGYGAESMLDPSGYIWSVYVNWTDSTPVNGFTDGTIVPEKENNASPVGVTCHEFGHQLGLPDLYDTSVLGGNSVVGIWCLMDYGCWAGYPQGSQPAHLSAWCKKFLGWLDLDIVSTTTINYSLPCVETSSQVVKLKILTADNPDNEYFLLEYRKKTNFDNSLPGEGLLIWHIDDSIASNDDRLKNNDVNSGDPHLGVDLIEADKTSAGGNLGDSGDPFPGSSNVTSFIPSEYNIKAYNNQPVPIYVLNISIGNTAIFDILTELKIKNLAKGEVKIGNNYTYSGTQMLIGFNLPEASDVEVLVYNLYGRLVKNFGKNHYQAGENNIQWIVKDENNEDLAPGLYFVVVKGNNIHKVEKFIIKK